MQRAFQVDERKELELSIAKTMAVTMVVTTVFATMALFLLDTALRMMQVIPILRTKEQDAFWYGTYFFAGFLLGLVNGFRAMKKRKLRVMQIIKEKSL